MKAKKLFWLWLAVMMAGRVFAQEGDGRCKAQGLLEQAAGMLKEGKADAAEPLLRQATTLDPTNALCWYYLGSAQISQKKFPEASQSMVTALKLDKEKPALGRRLQREARDALGLAYAYQKDYAKAVEAYRDALATDPDYPGFHYNLACVKSLAGDRDGALSALKSALECDARQSGGPSLPDPSDDEDFKGLLGSPRFQAVLLTNVGPQPNDGPAGALARDGARLFAAGDFAAAAAKEREATEKDATSAPSWFLLGGALEALGRQKEAAEAYSKAMTSNVAPGILLKKPLVRYAQLAIGHYALDSGNPQGAAAAFQAAVQADPFQPAAHYGLAQAYAGLSDRGKAEEALKKAFSLKENLLAVDPSLPDPRKDPAFAKWADDKGWQATVAALVPGP